MSLLDNYNPEKEQYPYIEEVLENWPLARLSADKDNFLKTVQSHTLEHLLEEFSEEELNDEIARTIFLEKKRLKEDPWRVDPKDEKKFWGKISKSLIKKSLDREATERQAVLDNNKQLLQQIVKRYAAEIVGSFHIKTYLFARTFLSLAFTRLLNSIASRNILKIFSRRYRLQQKIQAKGEIERIRALSKKGTVVIVPTHFSNLDSILIGLTADFIGIPALSYGAGLNLFNTGILAFFMNRLGAYRIDRRKKSAIYLETLKAYSTLSIERGTHSLFFPGGTRSRSGMIEKRLKMGILSTTIEAQRRIFEADRTDKVFIVPMVLGYHFVLEAKSLIEQHLKQTGEEKYLVPNDEFGSYRKMANFIYQFFGSNSEIIVSFGKPIDVFGNFVDEQGNSLSSQGHLIDIRDYFVVGDALQRDEQRDTEYTKLLAEVIVKRLHAENIVLSSQVMAFTAYNLIKAKHPNLDDYGILRLNESERIIARADFLAALQRTRHQLLLLEKNNRLKLSEIIKNEDLKVFIKDGLKHLGTYHPEKVLKENKNGDFVTDSTKLLLYYHNHLIGYELERSVRWLV
jgi:glycerol-3-phosphate O-acyltransferase